MGGKADSSGDLKKLCRRDIWLGGKVGSYERSKSGWPDSLTFPWGTNEYRSSSLTWTLSPEVELGGHRMRVCVSWAGGDHHRVRVFADNEQKYPGGEYKSRFLPYGWPWKIAKQERRDGGKTGPVESRDLLLKEAKDKAKGVNTQHKDPLYCDLCFDALLEVEKDHPEDDTDDSVLQARIDRLKASS